jgi:hypothetical protein
MAVCVLFVLKVRFDPAGVHPRPITTVRNPASPAIR